jgi:hypothetical protein
MPADPDQVPVAVQRLISGTSWDGAMRSGSGRPGLN